MSYIEFKHVIKEYNSGETKIRALNDASFAVEKGEFVSIVGPSGCGKTTILSLIVSVVLSIYCTIGVPEWFARITFLSMSIGARAAIPLAAINVYMFIYIMGKVIDNKDVKLIGSKIIPFIISVIMTRICLYGDGNNYLEIWQVVLSTVLFLCIFYLSMNLYKQKCRRILMVMMASITLIGGLTVNPLVQSVNAAPAGSHSGTKTPLSIM